MKDIFLAKQPRALKVSNVLDVLDDILERNIPESLARVMHVAHHCQFTNIRQSLMALL